MRIATVTGAFNSTFSEFFPKIEIINPSRDAEFKNYDLIIFTGGEDINPEMYGEKNKYSSCNKERDSKERIVFEHYYFSTKCKILGVCRGHQFISVMLGGKLYQDLYFQKINHNGYHGFDHNFNTELIPSKVNSMHHQGVYRFGTDSVRILATHKGVAEAVCYHNGSGTTRIITVQWHPEFMGDTNFFNWISRWAEFKVDINLNNTMDRRTFNSYVENEMYKVNGNRETPPPSSLSPLYTYRYTSITNDNNTIISDDAPDFVGIERGNNEVTSNEPPEQETEYYPNRAGIPFEEPEVQHVPATPLTAYTTIRYSGTTTSSSTSNSNL